MAQHDESDKSSFSNWKPGSEPEKAASVGSPDDFGAPEAGRSRAERDYVSRNTKMSDPGAAQPRSGEAPGQRVSGAGGRNSGVGSSSGGDIDTDVTGVGFGGSGVAQAAPDEPPGPDEAQPQRAVARDIDQTRSARELIDERSVVQDPDVSDEPLNQGADAAPTHRGDDSFAGEISRGEASGDDNS